MGRLLPDKIVRYPVIACLPPILYFNAAHKIRFGGNVPLLPHLSESCV
jgi:hypothetical protein